ncbi:hypothetical protein TNCV_3008461 [Trichonephila clavipes]|nr:hypothetical protein TNCV_3008461 [Trichonephila clavipes]
MVWAGIMINGRTCLHVVANGSMTGQRYIDEVLLPHDCLDSEGIQRLVWPARSPDLNPIENVWDALGRQVAGRNYPPTNKNTLIRALTEEWDKLPQQLLDNVVQTNAERAHSSLLKQNLSVTGGEIVIASYEILGGLLYLLAVSSGGDVSLRVTGRFVLIREMEGMGGGGTSLSVYLLDGSDNPTRIGRDRGELFSLVLLHMRHANKTANLF